MITDKRERLLKAIRNLFDDEFSALLILHAIAGGAAKQPGHGELKEALLALDPKPNAVSVGKLLAKMRGKDRGGLRLDGELNRRRKGWVYCLVPVSAPTPEVIRQDIAQETREELEALESARPIDYMTNEQLATLVEASPDRVEKVMDKIEADHAKNIAETRRAANKASVGADDELAALMKHLRRQQRAENPSVWELENRNREQREALRRDENPNPLNPYSDNSPVCVNPDISKGIWVKNNDGTYSYGGPGSNLAVSGLQAGLDWMEQTAYAAGAPREIRMKTWHERQCDILGCDYDTFC